MSRVLVMVMNPRAIPDCVASFRALQTDVAWMTGYTAAEVYGVTADVVHSTRYDHYLLVPDDCVVSQAAVNAVVALLDDGHPAATGWCRLAVGDERANLTTTPIRGDRPSVSGYDWWLADDVAAHPDEVVPTGFMGMALTGMDRGMWLRYPHDGYRSSRGNSFSSDFHLSRRLRDAGIPMVAARSGYIDHRKEIWNRRDRSPENRLMVGELPRQVTIQTSPQEAT